VCTFSKTLAPSLRLGFAVLPTSLVEPARQLRSLMDAFPPTGHQHAMHRFVVDGHLERHLRRTRRIHRERNRYVASRLTELVDDGRLRSATIGNAGLHFAARLPDGVDDASVRSRTRAGGVALGDFAGCWADRARWEGIVVGYGAVTMADLPEALDIVASALA
jgi:GntR family transcriptional regulator/MocR family aminotransferase